MTKPRVKVTRRRFLEGSDPLRQLCWRAEGGWRYEKMLGVRVFLALRQLLSLAKRGGWHCPARLRCVRGCVKLAGAMQSIFRSDGRSFPSAWQCGKELGGKSQIVVI